MTFIFQYCIIGLIKWGIVMARKKVVEIETEEVKEEKSDDGFHPDWVSIAIKLFILIAFIIFK